VLKPAEICNIFLFEINYLLQQLSLENALGSSLQSSAFQVEFNLGFQMQEVY